MALAGASQGSQRRRDRIGQNPWVPGTGCGHTPSMGHRLGQRGLACFALATFAGCSTTATISRTNGPALDADILVSDANSMRVRDDYGREFLITREEVADIDHPGNVLTTIGVVLIAMSIPMFVAALSPGSESRETEWSGLELVYGIPEAVTGLCLSHPWLESLQAFQARRKGF